MGTSGLYYWGLKFIGLFQGLPLHLQNYAQ
jgi:hypothetical protein